MKPNGPNDVYPSFGQLVTFSFAFFSFFLILTITLGTIGTEMRSGWARQGGDGSGRLKRAGDDEKRPK